MEKSKRIKTSIGLSILVFAFWIGFIFLLGGIFLVVGLNFSKMIKVPSSYTILLDKLQNQTQYKLISIDKEDGDDNIQVYNMEFEKSIFIFAKVKKMHNGNTKS